MNKNGQTLRMSKNSCNCFFFGGQVCNGQESNSVWEDSCSSPRWVCIICLWSKEEVELTVFKCPPFNFSALRNRFYILFSLLTRTSFMLLFHFYLYYFFGIAMDKFFCLLAIVVVARNAAAKASLLSQENASFSLFFFF